MHVFEKIGGIDKAYRVLQNMGWTKTRHALEMQKSRKRISKEVAFLLLAATNRYHLPITAKDLNISINDNTPDDPEAA